MNERVQQSRKSLLLLLLLILFAAVQFQRSELGLLGETQQVVQKNQAKKLNLDEATKAEIRPYFAGIKLLDKERTVAYAMKLDGGIGSKLYEAGKYRQAYPVYQKVLAISYDQGSLQGVGRSFSIISVIMREMGNRNEAIKTAMLTYKVGRAMNKPYEYGVAQLQIARLMDRHDPSMAMSWRRLRARESLKAEVSQKLSAIFHCYKISEKFLRN